jgi:uncharacterized surface protein with fasciclin (FAS1) repeats
MVITKMLSFTAMIAIVFTAFNCGNNDDTILAQQNVLELVVASADFDILEAAALKAGSGVTDILGGTTQISVFAPIDAAFVTYLNVADEAAAIAAVNGLTPAAAADLLLFHLSVGIVIRSPIIPDWPAELTTARSANNKAFVTKTGAAITINNANVISADVLASNGVLHIIDAVLTPPAGDIIAVATSPANAASFNILAASLSEAGLLARLKGESAYLTVFAPTDDAFMTLFRSPAFFNNADLTEAQVLAYIDNITANSTPLNLTTLTQVLLYHIVNGPRYSINLINNQSLTTLKTDPPQTLTVGIGTSVTIDGSASEPSTITVANISASNGVIHVINRVLLP